MEPYLKTDFLWVSWLCKILHLLNDMSFAGFCALFKIIYQIYKIFGHIFQFLNVIYASNSLDFWYLLFKQYAQRFI